VAALTNAYTTLAIAKERAEIRDSIDDPSLKLIISAVSRQIEDYCRRRFYAATQTRYYSPRHRDHLILDADLLTVTSLKSDEDGNRTYEITWSASLDYYLGPANNATDGLPYWEVCRDFTNGSYWFPTQYQRSVQIIGSWGYSATTPAVVQEACLAQIDLMMRAPDVALGEEGAGPMLTQLRGVGLHPFTRRLLDPYKMEHVG
jgi:hypothetical protein